MSKRVRSRRSRMLTRAAAALIDLRLALARAIRRVWRVPGDVLGRLVMGACGVSEPTRRIAVPDLGEVCIVEDPRVGRYLDRAPLRPFARDARQRDPGAHHHSRTDPPPRDRARSPVERALGRCSCRPTASRRWRRCSRARTRTETTASRSPRRRRRPSRHRRTVRRAEELHRLAPASMRPRARTRAAR